MRIRKHLRRGNVGGESSSGAQRTYPGSREQSEGLAPSSGGEKPAETSVQTRISPGAEVEDQGPAGEDHRQGGSGPGVVVRPQARRHGVIERVDSTSRSAFTWLDKLRHSKGFTELEPYSNLEDFVSSLTKKDDGRNLSTSNAPRSEVIVEGGDMSRLVGGVDLKAHPLVRHSSVCSESSSKDLNVGSIRPALESCDHGSPVPTSITHRNERFNVQLQRNATSSPNAAAERAKDSAEAGTDKISSDARGMPSQGAEDLERLIPNLNDKYKPKEDGRSYKSYWEQARVNTSWMRDSAEPFEVETRLGYGESSGQKDFAGAGPKKPLNHEISDVSCQPASDEASLEQRHVGGSGDYSASVAKSVDTTRHGALLQIASMQDPHASETTQRRSIRSRRIPSLTVADKEQDLRPTPPLSPDHPAQQTKDSLAFSLYTVFLRAGKAGLTAREAMAGIGEAHRLAGVEDGAVQSSRRIAKLLRNSAYYMEVGEGRFALCTAVIDSDQQSNARGKTALKLQEEDSWQSPRSGKAARRRLSESSSTTADDSKSLASSEELAPAVQKKRKRAVRAAAPEPEAETEVRSKPVRTGRPKKLKYMKQENAESLGNQCNRTDGKGWVCPLLAKPGYQLCDHHLDKLRCKPGSRSKKKKLLKMAAAEADQAEAATSTRDETHSVDTARHELTTP